MSFWSDLSPAVKGVVVLGVVGLLYFGIAAVAGLPPFGSATGEAVQTQRGVGATAP